MLLHMTLFLYFNGWVVVHCIYVPHHLYPLLLSPVRLCPCLGCCKPCCTECWGARILSDHDSLWMYAQEWDCRVTWWLCCCCCLVAQSCLILQPHGRQPSNRLILCHPLLLLPSIFPTIRVFSNESALRIRWPKYWSFNFSISPSNEYSGLTSFKIDWLNLLAVQGTVKSLLQHHSSKASVVQHPAFFMVQLSHPYVTTGKTIALTIWTFVGKVMSLFFNMLSRFVIAFSSKEQASFNFMAAVPICSDFGAGENKMCHCFRCFPIYLPWSDETRCYF